MKNSINYIMRDQHRGSIDDIMNYDLTWRQKRSNRSMHLSIIAGLSVLSFISQVI